MGHWSHPEFRYVMNLVNPGLRLIWLMAIVSRGGFVEHLSRTTKCDQNHTSDMHELGHT
jgi:hypothetical protein